MANGKIKSDGAAEMEACVKDLRGALARANRALERIERLGMAGLVDSGYCEAGVKPGLDFYEWGELAIIADEIAGCESEDDALDLAKRYGLVDVGGRVIPATKAFCLVDGLAISARLVGVWHDETESGTKAGLTFIAAIDDRVEMESGQPSGYKGCTADGYLETLFEKKLPPVLKENVKAAAKGYLGEDCAEKRGVFRLWIPSVVELFGKEFDDVESSTKPNIFEGTQYSAYRDAGVSRSTRRNEFLKYDFPYWTRSICAFDEMYWSVTCGGTPTPEAGLEELGIVFGFAL